jgi:hypothetical protein
MSSAFRPQMDGQSEVTNCVITMYLRCLVGDRPRSWIRWLPWAEYYYNTSYQTTLKTTSFQVVYVRPSLAMIPFQAGSTRIVAVDHQLRDRDIFLAEMKDKLLQAQAVMKTSYDKMVRTIETWSLRWEIGFGFASITGQQQPSGKTAIQSWVLSILGHMKFVRRLGQFLTCCVYLSRQKFMMCFTLLF